MRLVNNGCIRRNGGKTWVIQRSGSFDGPAVKAYMEGVQGFSKYGITPPVMSDSAWAKTRKIGDYIYQKLYWYGNNELTYPSRENSRAITILKMADANQSLNGGRGPKHICSAVSYTMIGILSAYGVIARIINGGTILSAKRDYAIEVFVPEYNKWVFFIPFSNAYVLLPDGTPASGIELQNYYKKDLNRLLTFKSGTPEYFPDKGCDRYGLAHGYVNWWTGKLTPDTVAETDTERSDRLSGGFFATVKFGTKNAFSLPWDRNGSIVYANPRLDDAGFYLALDDASAKFETGTVYGVLSNIDDIYPTFNTIEVTDIIKHSSGMLQILLEHCMIEFSKFQTSTDKATWSDVHGVNSIFVPQFGAGSIYIRAVDVNGCPSNVVEIAY